MNDYSMSGHKEKTGMATLQEVNVVFKSKWFIGIFVTILLSLILNNIYVIYQTGELLSLIPIIFYSIILLIVALKHKWTRLAVKLWAIIMILGFAELLFGLLYNFAMGNSLAVYSTVPIRIYVFDVLQLVAGCCFLFLTNRYIEIQ